MAKAAILAWSHGGLKVVTGRGANTSKSRSRHEGGCPLCANSAGTAPERIRDRCCGALLGLAVGDALGATLEFRSPGTFEPLTDMSGGGPWGFQPGQWTDDTSMALCLAESLVERGEFDPQDQMERYVRWYRHGHLSSTGRCFDIGITTEAALRRFEQTGESYAGSSDPYCAGNGSIMRLAPVPIFYSARKEYEQAIDRAEGSSRTAHALFLTGEIASVASDSFKRRNPPQIRGTGYVVQSLEAALWAFHHGTSFRDSVRDACLQSTLATTQTQRGQYTASSLGRTMVLRVYPPSGATGSV